MKNFIVFFGLFMGLASAMNIKEFEEKYHEDFANPEDEAKAAEALAEHEAQINKQHEDFIQGKANFDEEINEFADMDDDEFANEKLGEMESPEDEPAARIFGGRKFYLGLIHDEGENTPEEIEELDKIYASIDRETLPESYDSRALGLVTAVKSQGNCGSCVAFATTAVLETNLLKAGASIDGLDISDQHLVDCGYGTYANGCNGAAGHGYARFYNEEGKEMIHENNYPYVMMENNYQCKQASYWHPGYKIEKGLWDYDCSDEEMMKLIYENGAVSTGVGVDTGFSYYSSGVYDTCTSTSTNHAVVIVGWGTENGIDYWIIKNSWGSWWGEQGYIRVKRSTCAARRCVWFKIESAGGVTDPDPTTPKPPEQSSCDMTKIFGGLNGDHTLKLTSHGNYYKAEVTCVEGVCKAKNPDIVDSCHYICGSPTCDHVNDVKCTGGYTDWSCCSETNKCSVGRGDCDSDSHCQAGLKCGKDNCVKFSYDFPCSGYDCCYDPNVPKCGPGNADWACCSETNKCGEGLGDCDSDSQCEEGLKCGKDNCHDYGTFPSSSYDCCFKPSGSCFEQNKDFYGNDVGSKVVSDEYDCQKECQNHDSCNYWTWTSHGTFNVCWMKNSDSGRKSKNGAISGPKFC